MDLSTLSEFDCEFTVFYDLSDIEEYNVHDMQEFEKFGFIFLTTWTI